MKRRTVILVSLIAVLLLAGLSACKQEAATESFKLNAGIPGVNIPAWEKSDEGLQNLPAINTSGTGSGVSGTLLAGLNNPPEFSNAKNLIVMVCEGLTTELIERSSSLYGNLILNSLPVNGTTSSKFSSSLGSPLSEFVKNDLDKLRIGIVSWGDTATNSLRRMTTSFDNDVAKKDVSENQFYSLYYVMGKGDFADVFANDSLNDFYKGGRVKTSSFKEAVQLYGNEEVPFSAPGHETYTMPANKVKLYSVFENDSSLPSFRQEMAFSLAWMQSVMNADGFCLLSSYSPSNELSAEDAKEFDEGVALAVKYVLENPDTALLICGCPADGSVADVCFYGLGNGVAVKSTLFESVSSFT